jgi:ADP-heptose:LPS heptosyltransferase
MPPTPSETATAPEAHEPKSRAPSILILLMGSLGDVARGLCLVAPLKGHFAGSRVTWLVEPKCAGLVALHPLIDEVIVFQRQWHPRAPMRLLAEFRQHRFDIALDLQRHLKSGFFSWCSGAARRIGFHRRDAKELNWLFNNEHIPAGPGESSKIHQYLEFNTHLGVPRPPRLEFGLSGPDIARVGPGVVAALTRPFVAVAMGSSWESKDWCAEGYGALIERVLKTGALSVVLLGDRSQKALAGRLAAAWPGPGLIDLTGKTTLPQLVAVLRAAAAGVGPDCGTGHLAAAVGTPYVALFGPTAPSRTAPYGCEHLVVQAEASCAPCYQRRCPGLDRVCMRRIDTEDVARNLALALAADGLRL